MGGGCWRGEKGGILDIILTRVGGGVGGGGGGSTGGEGGILDIILTPILTSFVKVVSGSKSDAGFETRSKCVNS